MQEVTSISASSYDPESLAPLLDEKVRDGWQIVSIVNAGTKIVAYLQREGDGSSEAFDTAETDDDAVVEAAVAAEPVEEPAGWAVAPDDTQEVPAVAAAGAAAAASAEPEAAASAEPESAAPTEPAAEEPAQQATPESTVPAGWYADPSGRFELRYWDGTAWTEHVSRAGQQYTDPPVA